MVLSVTTDRGSIDESVQSNSSSSVGPIIGGVVGVLLIALLVVIIVIIVVIVYRRKRRNGQIPESSKEQRYDLYSNPNSYMKYHINSLFPPEPCSYY